MSRKPPEKLPPQLPPQLPKPSGPCVIVVGNFVDGFTLYGTFPVGIPFATHDEAVNAAEEYFGRSPDPWWIVSLTPLA